MGPSTDAAGAGAGRQQRGMFHLQGKQIYTCHFFSRDKDVAGETEGDRAGGRGGAWSEEG